MANLSYTEQGNGRPVILIHGFPFNQLIWTDFAEKLAANARVFTVDLPGFGKSPGLPVPFTLSDVAGMLNQWIKEKNITNPILVGHSLGGYVALAMAEMQPEVFSGLVLFHSTAFPDSDEKKANRNKVIEFIEKNGVQTFTSNFITPLFADHTHPGIKKLQAIAVDAKEETVKGYTVAMRDRKDQTGLLKSFRKPIMIISGEKDGGIPVESVKQQAALSPDIRLQVFPEVGHMGMVEKPEETLKLLQEFISQK